MIALICLLTICIILYVIWRNWGIVAFVARKKIIVLKKETAKGKMTILLKNGTKQAIEYTEYHITIQDKCYDEGTEDYKRIEEEIKKQNNI